MGFRDAVCWVAEFVILLSLAQRHEMPTGNKFSVTLIDRSM